MLMCTTFDIANVLIGATNAYLSYLVVPSLCLMSQLYNCTVYMFCSVLMQVLSECTLGMGAECSFLVSKYKQDLKCISYIPFIFPSRIRGD